MDPKFIRQIAVTEKSWLLHHCRHAFRIQMWVPLTLLSLAVLLVCCRAQWKPPTFREKQAIVHLFEWKWNDIARECEEFLRPKGFGGIQVSPPNEYVIAMDEAIQRPWWERYQPVSYNIESRSGNLTEFKNMVSRCNRVGVRIYVDAVFNHMTGGWPHNTTGTSGSSFDYYSENYPEVPYDKPDFNDDNCHTASGNIESYQDADQVRNCRLSGLIDLNQSQDYVRSKIQDYLNTLIGIGVAGFRVDAAKHMWPDDLKVIFEHLDDLNTDFFKPQTRPFIYQEVIDYGGEVVHATNYIGNGRVTEFRYGSELSSTFRGYKDLKYLRNFGEEWGFLDSSYALVFVDNHDTQRGTLGSPILTFRNSKKYKMANAFMLSWPYGFPRLMSSYYWPQFFDANGIDENSWMGPPHDADFNILSPEINPDGSCAMDWVCEHRWMQITDMVKFRDLVRNTPVLEWWDNGKNQISFCRGSKGFVAMNNDNYDLNQDLQTCLPAGTYCDVISGIVANGSCTGKWTQVRADGMAAIDIKTSDEDGSFVIHIKSRLRDVITEEL